MLKQLLGRGYFPAELPPPFWSESFGNFAFGNRAFRDQKRSRGQCIAHNIPRAGHARRRLDIPNPPHFAKIAGLLADPANLATLESFTRASRYSLTWPRRDNTGHRAFTYRCTHAVAETFRSWNRAGRRYVLTADVQRFYHSVYTHTIPWALHTKHWSKSHTKLSCLGNDADRLIRESQDGQTMGIPIGPDTSFLIAETLMAYVDSRLLAFGLTDGVRFMDEWEFAFDSLGQAERARAAIDDALSELELELNPVKVAIDEGPKPLNAPWVTVLRSMPLPPQGQEIHTRQLIPFFDRAFELASLNRTHAILNWAVSRAMSFRFNWASWQAMEPLLLQCAASEPGSLPRVLRLLCAAWAEQGFAVHRDRLARTLASIVSVAAQRAHWSEVAWGVWGHIAFRLPMDKSVAAVLASTDDPIVALCALDAHQKGLVATQDLDAAIQRWSALVEARSLDSRDWLLAYESAHKGWLPGPQPGFLSADPHYGPMAANGVNFYRHDADPFKLTMGHQYSAPNWRTPARPYP